MAANRALKAGDVFAVDTSVGERLIQFIRDDDLMGELVGIVPVGAREGDPARMHVFYPVRAALRYHLISPAGYRPLSDADAATREFRAGGGYLWDGGDDRYVGPYTSAHRRLPFRAVVTHETLVLFLERDASNEDLDDDTGALVVEDAQPLPAKGERAVHLLFAPFEEADAFVRAVQKQGLSATFRNTADGTCALIEVEQPLERDAVEVEGLLLKLASNTGVSYDGSETSL